MLVLSRKKNESIVINDDITIVVVEIRGDRVRLGVEAPKEVPVHRREVFDAIRRNEVAAADKVSEAKPEEREITPIRFPLLDTMPDSFLDIVPKKTDEGE
jgi:carbon storage regulator